MTNAHNATDDFVVELEDVSTPFPVLIAFIGGLVLGKILADRCCPGGGD